MTRTRWRPEVGRIVGRKPLPIGSWGLIRTYPMGSDGKGRPRWVKAVAQYGDFDGVTRQVQATGKSATAATQNLRQKLQDRTLAGRHGDLTAMTRFADAATLWLSKVDEMVSEGRKVAGYGRYLPSPVEEPHPPRYG